MADDNGLALASSTPERPLPTLGRGAGNADSTPHRVKSPFRAAVSRETKGTKHHTNSCKTVTASELPAEKQTPFMT